MQQLSGQDASFLYFETPNAPMHVGGIAIYDPSTAPGGAVRFKDILATVESRIDLARTFRQKLAWVPLNLDHPWWVSSADFDLEFHVRHVALPQPGDWRQLCIQAARLHGRALDLSRPLWEMYVIEGLDRIDGLPPGSFAIVSKTHHAAIDGVSGSELITVLHDLEPDASPPQPERPFIADREPNDLELLARTFGNNIQQPFKFARVLARTLPAASRVARGIREQQFGEQYTVPRTRFNGTISPHRVVDGRTFALDEIRAIKSAVPGATVNDAVLTIVGGALRRYLESKNELPAESAVAMAPISVRDAGEQSAMGNRVSAMAVRLRSDIADPMERLAAVHAGTAQSKALTEAVGARLLTDYSQFIPSSVAGLAARVASRAGLANRMTPMFNTTVTNVPGPQVPLYSGGARLVTQYGLGPILDGMALIHPVFSYCGNLTISFTCCREIMPDPAWYAECIEDAFAELHAAATA